CSVGWQAAQRGHIPILTSRAIGDEQLLELAVQSLRQVVLHILRSAQDSRLEAFFAGAAVALYYDTLQTEKAGTVIPRRPQLASQLPQQRQCQCTYQPRRQGTLEQHLNARCDHFSQALAGFKHDVADEAVTNHYVCV